VVAPYIPWLLLVVLVAQPPAAPPPPPPPPDTEIFLASLSASASGLTVGEPANITSSPGYDNQPSFTPDGRSILFTSIRGGTQTDIYRYDIASRVTTRVTDTPESEYSATITPDGAHISVIRVEADQTQRLWRFTIDGRQPEVVLANVKPVGYHAWVDDQTLALYVLGQPATLQVASVRSGASRVIVSGIGRSLQPIPGRGTVSIVERQAGPDPAAPVKLLVRELDPKTGRITPLVDAVAGAREADLAWTPDGMLLMADKDALYGWRRGDREWRKVADLGALGLRGVSRIAVNAAGDRIAFVVQPR
jgi:dipeptidyl aminopeptidase/acylaminoacyl peptidase